MTQVNTLTFTSADKEVLEHTFLSSQQIYIYTVYIYIYIFVVMREKCVHIYIYIYIVVAVRDDHLLIILEFFYG